MYAFEKTQLTHAILNIYLSGGRVVYPEEELFMHTSLLTVLWLRVLLNV